MRQVSMTTRDELVAAIAGRYAWSGRLEKAAQRQAMFDRAEAFAAALARDLDRCAAIQAVMARELEGTYA
jgi:hypothetical protein